MNTQIKILLLLLIITLSSCCSTSDILKKYGPVETAVFDGVTFAMLAEFGRGDIRTTFNVDSLRAVLLKYEKNNEYELLSRYNLEFTSCKNYYRLRVYDKWCLILDDVSCTNDYVDGRVYAGQNPLPINYDLCNCSDK